jgi:hypothetical protein
MKRYADSIQRWLKGLTPWKIKTRTSALRERLLARGVKPGETAVILEGGEPNIKRLYGDDTKILRSS